MELYLGRVTGPAAEMETDAIVRTATAKEVTGGHRLFGIVEGALLYAQEMAAEGPGSSRTCPRACCASAAEEPSTPQQARRSSGDGRARPAVERAHLGQAAQRRGQPDRVRRGQLDPG